MDTWILTITTFLPLAGTLFLLLIPKDHHQSIRHSALFFALLAFAASICLVFRFDTVATGMQFEVMVPWVADLGISYHLGIDGISLLLILLTTFLNVIAVLSTFRAVQHSYKGFYASLLLLETGILGVFVSLDLFLFYVFWEVMLIPMYFLIGIWGGQRRVYAAIKFVLFTMVGSLLMLVAILVLFFQYHSLHGVYTFDLMSITGMPLSRDMQLWLFAAFALAFAIKVPMWPFHTWLPDAHVEAPTAGSVILAVIGIIYGALVAMVQKDIKSLVAFSSVSHMGFVMLGMMTMNLQGMQGSIIQMINHGVSTGALFILVGMIYERRHTRLIKEYGGIASKMPVYATFFMIVMLSSIGVPGTNGFVGEFTILLGAWSYHKVYAILGASGIILAACYMLWMYQRVFYGKVTNPANEKLIDLDLREKIILVPVVIMIFWIGIYPKPFFRILEPSARTIIEQVERGRSQFEMQQRGRIQETSATETAAPSVMEDR